MILMRISKILTVFGFVMPFVLEREEGNIHARCVDIFFYSFFAVVCCQRTPIIYGRAGPGYPVAGVAWQAKKNVRLLSEGLKCGVACAQGGGLRWFLS